MADQAASFRRILKSSSIIGGASFVNIAVGLARTKVLAALLGPSGVGLVSLYTGIISTAATVASMGVGTVGTRQIAEAIGRDDVRALAVARRAIVLGTMLLATVGAIVVWSLREVLAAWVLNDATQSTIVGWLALGVGLSVASASQGALIQGMRRIGDMARVSMYGAFLGTVLGVGILWLWGQAGLVAYVLIGPLVSFLLSHVYVSRLPKTGTGTISLADVTRQWNALLRLGIPFMGAGVVGALIQLWIRVEVGETLGANGLGQFQAAWSISMQYIGFVLGAMAADYYPRLTGVIHDRNVAVRLVNEQTEIALLLSAPVFIAMMALAPFVIQFLYSTAFAPATNVLRWQILGDVLKVASWPLGFVILAASDGKMFFWSETSAFLIMVGLISGLSHAMGLQITGIAYFAGYCYYIPLVYMLARRKVGFHWSKIAIRLLATTFALCVSVGILASMTRWGALLGCVTAGVFGLYSLGQLSQMSNLPRPFAKVGAAARRLTMRSH